MLMVYTGRGKGKTSAAIGTTIRALSSGKKVAYFQFMKSELNAVSRLKDMLKEEYLKNFDFFSFGSKGFVDPKNPKPEDYNIIQNGWEKAKTLFGKYDVIVLDELNVVLLFGLLNKDNIIRDLKKYNMPEIENPKPYSWPLIVVTGIDASDEMIEIADLVSNINEIKHPFKKGYLATKGIDF